MADLTKIEWTDATFNPWIGCQHVSPGCEGCYAEAWSNRFHYTEWGPHGARRRTSLAKWREPRLWNARAPEFAREHGRRRRVFCASLADVFDNQVPKSWRADLFDLIRETPKLEWQLLTKRPQNIAKMLPPDWGDGWPHVWLGATTENKAEYEERWPILARAPSRLRFISYEPALAPLTMKSSNWLLPDWVICGGETGRVPRLMEPDWARRMRDQCHALGLPFFMKQMTARAPIPSDLLVRQFPGAEARATAEAEGAP